MKVCNNQNETELLPHKESKRIIVNNSDMSVTNAFSDILTDKYSSACFTSTLYDW